MRVVAGAYKGRRLAIPAGRSTRPTADRVREAVFSILGPIDGLSALDLFAGSGALGIEAASRGAEPVVFVDDDPRAVATIRRNLAAIELDARVERRDALAFLRARRTTEAAPFDLVFVDPPYSSADRVVRGLVELLPSAIGDASRIVTESHQRKPLEIPLPLAVERVYGDTRVTVHRGS